MPSASVDDVSEEDLLVLMWFFQRLQSFQSQHRFVTLATLLICAAQARLFQPTSLPVSSDERLEGERCLSELRGWMTELVRITESTAVQTQRTSDLFDQFRNSRR